MLFDAVWPIPIASRALRSPEAIKHNSGKSIFFGNDVIRVIVRFPRVSGKRNEIRWHSGRIYECIRVIARLITAGEGKLEEISQNK